MNDSAPLTPDAVDALLSADLDGDLEAAARDLGLSAPEARARLVATPGTDARRVALTHARDLLASRPPIEASVEDRLVATALAGDELANVRARRTRTERQWRRLVAVGSVAAAIAVVVGVASMDSTQRDSSGNASVESRQDSAPTEKGTQRPGPTSAAARPDLGDVSDAAALRAPARTLLKTATPERTSGQSPTAPGVVSTPRAADSALDGSLEDAAAFALSASPACSANRLQDYGITALPALIARGTVDGAPVVILLYEGSGNPYADVIRVSDCTLVRRQPLR